LHLFEQAEGLVQLPGVGVRANERGPSHDVAVGQRRERSARGGHVPQRRVHGDDRVPDDGVPSERGPALGGERVRGGRETGGAQPGAGAEHLREEEPVGRGPRGAHGRERLARRAPPPRADAGADLPREGRGEVPVPQPRGPRARAARRRMPLALGRAVEPVAVLRVSGWVLEGGAARGDDGARGRGRGPGPRRRHGRHGFFMASVRLSSGCVWMLPLPSPAKPYWPPKNWQRAGSKMNRVWRVGMGEVNFG